MLTFTSPYFSKMIMHRLKKKQTVKEKKREEQREQENWEKLERIWT